MCDDGVMMMMMMMMMCVFSSPWWSDETHDRPLHVLSQLTHRKISDVTHTYTHINPRYVSQKARRRSQKKEARRRSQKKKPEEEAVDMHTHMALLTL